jgi:hypothetical protein
VSASIFLFANIELNTNVATLFGLEVLVSKDKIVAALQLLLIVCLIGFVLKYLEYAPRGIARLMRVRDERWWQPISIKIEKFQGREFSDYPDDDPNDQYHPDWDDLEYEKRAIRKQRRQRVLGTYRQIATINQVIAQLFFPLAVAFLALRHPEFILILE